MANLSDLGRVLLLLCPWIARLIWFAFIQALNMSISCVQLDSCRVSNWLACGSIATDVNVVFNEGAQVLL